MESGGWKMNRGGWFMLVVLSVLWGGSFFFIGVAVQGLPPLTIAALRVSLAAITLLVVLYFSGVLLPRDQGVWRSFLVMGLLNNVIPFCLIIWGQTRIASGLASILNATTPLFAVVAAHLLTTDEKITPQKVAGLLIGFGGVIVIFGQDASQGVGHSTFGQLAVLGAAVSYSLAGIYGRRFARLGVRPVVTATGQVTASSLLLIPAALVLERPLDLPIPGLEVWLAVVSLAVVSTAFAYILYFRILAIAGATNVLLVTLLIPLSAIVLGALFLGEQLAARQLVGMVLIGLGLLAIDGRIFIYVQQKLKLGSK